jgi:hypothetical protein
MPPGTVFPFGEVTVGAGLRQWFSVVVRYGPLVTSTVLWTL